MASEEGAQSVLNESLKNLEILPSAIKSNGRQSNNPFNTQSSQENEFRKRKFLNQIFGPKCDCGERLSSSNTTPKSVENKTEKSWEHSVLHSTTFKSRNKNEKKAIVKESVLKNIGKCIHNNVIKKDSAGNNDDTHTTSKCFGSENNGDVLDFRLLVNQYSGLSLSSPAEQVNYSQKSFKSMRPQTNKFKSDSKLANRDKGKCSKEEIANIPQPSSSCSQQARLNIMPCDVTIDEIASYFETLVYIPKKMSSMAEMMYI